MLEKRYKFTYCCKATSPPYFNIDKEETLIKWCEEIPSYLFSQQNNDWNSSRKSFLPGLDKKVDTGAHSFDSSGLAYTHSVQLFLLVFLKVCTEKKYSWFHRVSVVEIVLKLFSLFSS